MTSKNGEKHRRPPTCTFLNAVWLLNTTPAAFLHLTACQHTRSVKPVMQTALLPHRGLATALNCRVVAGSRRAVVCVPVVGQTASAAGKHVRRSPSSLRVAAVSLFYPADIFAHDSATPCWHHRGSTACAPTPHSIQRSMMHHAAPAAPDNLEYYLQVTVFACVHARAWPNCGRAAKDSSSSHTTAALFRPLNSCMPLAPCCPQPAQVEASFSTLLDDEDEFEYEEGDEAEITIEDDIDETLLVDNLGLSDEVGMPPALSLPCFVAVCQACTCF